MTTHDLLVTLKQRNIKLSVDDGNLRYHAPKGELTDELKQAIRKHKAALIGVLTASTEAEPSTTKNDSQLEVKTTQRKPVNDNRGDLFLPAEPQTPSVPKAASTDRKPAHNADKSDADRLLSVWVKKHPYEMRYREQVIDMAIYAGLFISVSGREAKWEAIEPAIIRWEDEGKITAWIDARYQINPLKFENLR